MIAGGPSRRLKRRKGARGSEPGGQMHLLPFEFFLCKIPFPRLPFLGGEVVPGTLLWFMTLVVSVVGAV